MRGLFILYIVNMLIFGVGGIYLTRKNLFQPGIEAFDILEVTIFLLVYFGLGLVGIWYFFAQSTYTLMKDRLVVVSSLGIFRRAEEILKKDIYLIQQVQDGRYSEDSFVRWGLVLNGGKRRWRLLYRQNVEVSYWLGEVVSDWSDIEFESVYDSR